MRYYVVSDVHSFYTPLITALRDKGFFEDKEPHKLVILGDLFDRGKQPLELQAFILDLVRKDEVILVRGNHEDLVVKFMRNIYQVMNHGVYLTHYGTNGTVDTVLALTGMDVFQAMVFPEECVLRMARTPFYKTFLPMMKDYFETKKHIFVHGWIPCEVDGDGDGRKETDIFHYIPDWRTKGKEEWEKARWYNGMIAAKQGVIEKGKTILCGHFPCAYGHDFIEKDGIVEGEETDFSPYYGKGIIAIDAYTVGSGKVNCVVIEDEPIE